jgi:hypothetical protein
MAMIFRAMSCLLSDFPGLVELLLEDGLDKGLLALLVGVLADTLGGLVDERG